MSNSINKWQKPFNSAVRTNNFGRIWHTTPPLSKYWTGSPPSPRRWRLYHPSSSLHLCICLSVYLSVCRCVCACGDMIDNAISWSVDVGFIELWARHILTYRRQQSTYYYTLSLWSIATEPSVTVWTERIAMRTRVPTSLWFRWELIIQIFYSPRNGSKNRENQSTVKRTLKL